MFQTSKSSRNYSPSAYSIDSFEDDRRHRPTRTALTNRQRSVTTSTSGSSAETATNGATASTAYVLEDQTLLDVTFRGKSSEPSGRKSSYHSATCGSRMRDLELEGSPSLIAAIAPNRADSGHSPTSLEAQRKLGDKNNGHIVGSRTALCKAASSGSEVFQQTERTSVKLKDSLKDLESDNLMPLQTGPRLVHLSSPPWTESGREKSFVGHLNASDPRFSPSNQVTECLNHSQQPHQSLSQSQPKTGLKKLLKSVKVTLWSTTASNQETTDDKHDGHGHHSLPSSNQSKISEASVEAHSPTNLAQNHTSHSNSVGPDDLTASLSRTVSACSIFSMGTATTSTVPSSSITPSSSWSSLPGAQSDCAIEVQSGPRCFKDQHPEMSISLHAGELGRHSTMATSHTLTYTNSPSDFFESSLGARNIQNKRDHSTPSTRVLKAKPSFGFLQNFKRAVTGVNPTVSFSFHNNSTPSLTTNAVSLPIGTVVRNNGLDPLPACHPLPLKSSQSSPPNLDYSLLTPTKLEPRTFESVPSPRAVSLFSSDFDEYSKIPYSAPSHLDKLLPQSELLRAPPTLNLRPVSMPFAASFSDKFLYNGLNPSDPIEQDPEHRIKDKNKLDEMSCAHHRHCPCCRSLADENVQLKNRIKELEMMVSKNQRLS